MAELLPCPFCGEKPLVIKNTLTATYYQIRCGNDECWVYSKTALHSKKEDAIEAWNTRTPKERGGHSPCLHAGEKLQRDCQKKHGNT